MGCAGQAVWERSIASADTVAVEAIVREYAGFVYRVAYSVLRHHQDAEDATQETFIRVWKHACELSEVRDRKTWLARIAWRIAIDKRRKAPEQSLDEAAEAGFELALSGPGAEQAAVRENMRALLERMVASLPSDLRDVVTLSTVEELSSAAAAEILGIPEASVRTRLFRARQMLKSKLLALDTQREKKLGRR